VTEAIGPSRRGAGVGSAGASFASSCLKGRKDGVARPIGRAFRTDGLAGEITTLCLLAPVSASGAKADGMEWTAVKTCRAALRQCVSITRR
jgi:hypothetical protein